MKVKTLSLTNYRGFERLEIEFHPQINVIAGINGVGKSSILHALRVLLSRGLPELTGVKTTATDLTDSDVFEGRDLGSVACTVNFDGHDYLFNAQRKDSDAVERLERQLFDLEFEIIRIEDNDDYLAMTREERASLDLDFSLQRLKKERRRVENRLKAERVFWRFTPVGFEGQTKTKKRRRVNLGRLINPLAVYFSPNRQLPPESREGKVEKAFDQKAAYANALDERPVSLEQFITWYEVQHFHLSGGNEKREILLEKIEKAAKEFADFDGLRISEQRRRELQVLKGGIWLSVRQLSDGERASLALIFDIARRLAVANPDLADPLTEASAVVMIDEIELHLHPTWQRQIMNNLTRTFPSCQFIVTTHSPQIIGEVDNSSIRLLRQTDIGIIEEGVNQSYGMESGWILRHIMGVSERDSDVKRKFDMLQDALNERILDRAENLVNSIRGDLEGFDPELQALKSMLSRLQILNRRKSEEN